MFRNAQITLIVPAYNESKLIDKTLRSVPAFVDHVVVVDDGSWDDTAARAAAIPDPRISVVRHSRNGGVGAALRTGYRRAFAAGADVAVVMAGDGQMDPTDLPALLSPVVSGRADYAKGNRLAHPDVARLMPLTRLIGNRMLSVLTRLATGLSVDDSQCGYTALHRRVGAQIHWQALWHGYGYPNDLLGKLGQLDARVCDVMVRPIYADEQSGVRLRHALLVVPFVLLRVVLTRAAAYLNAMPKARAGQLEPSLGIDHDEQEARPNA